MATKTFEEMWARTGCQYGEHELENVRLGWNMYAEYIGQTIAEMSDGAIVEALDQILDELVRRGHAAPTPLREVMENALETISRQAREDIVTARWVVEHAAQLSGIVGVLHIGPKEEK